MRKNCPYCASEVTVSERADASKWTFVRCAQCEGVTLLSRPTSDPLRAPVTESRSNLESVIKKETLADPIPTSEKSEKVTRDIKPNHFETSLLRTARPAGRSRQISVAFLALGLGFSLLVWNHDQQRKKFVESIQNHLPKTSSILNISAQPAEPRLAAVSKSSTPTSVMGETRAPAAQAPIIAPILRTAHVSTPAAILRAGPGTTFHKVGLATAELQLMIRDSRDGWLKVEVTLPGSPAHQVAWIRQDLVKN